MVDFQKHLELLQQAVSEEKAAIEDFFRKSKLLSKNEQRKQGLLLFPLKVAEITNDEVTFRTSFPINDTYFRKGVAVTITADGQPVRGRINELDEFFVSVRLLEESDADFYESAELAFREDDRTLQCMELGLRFAGEKTHLLNIAKSFTAKKDFSSTSSNTDSELNGAQRKAVDQMISDLPSVIIQGPPGTGKTTVLTEGISQLIKSGKKVVITAPSNTAVDHLSLQLIENNISLLRLGNEEKIHPNLLPFTMDGYLERSSHEKVIRNLKKQLQKAQEIADRHIRNFTKEAADEKRLARADIRNLRKEMRQIEEQFRLEQIEKVAVIAGTPVGLFNQLPSSFLADVVVMDEAGQSTEPLTWLSALFGNRLILAGDPQQLPPTVLSPKAAKLGLSKSLLETAIEFGNYQLLNEQYRMSDAVVTAINEHFYENQLLTAREFSKGELTFIDMAGFGEGELRNEESGSISNQSEMRIVEGFLREVNWQKDSTVILSPYNAQIGELKSQLPDWRISTIDAIQGQEAENILISLVRSNDEGEIGFLKDYRRTNVAISRAKERCVLIGDSATLANDPFYASLIEYIEQKGFYQSAWEFGT